MWENYISFITLSTESVEHRGGHEFSLSVATVLEMKWFPCLTSGLSASLDGLSFRKMAADTSGSCLAKKGENRGEVAHLQASLGW
jgi:hypothetical protein